MEVNRAIQILGASQQIDVTFEGESIWIDEVDPSTNAVQIHSIGSGKAMTVPVDRLHEPSGYQ